MHRLSAPISVTALAAFLLAAAASLEAEPFDLPLVNPWFTGAASGSGVPEGWSRYGGGGKNQELRVVNAPGGGNALLIADGDTSRELGVIQTVPLQGGETYQATVRVCGVPDASTAGAYLQFRFLPSQQFVQTGLMADSARAFSEVAVRATAPPGTTQGVVYLYTHRGPTPKVLVSGLRVHGGLPPPPPPPPPPVPPQYAQLKDLHLDIRLIEAAQPRAVIVAPKIPAYQEAADAIQREIAARSGVKIPVIPDDAPEAALPLRQHVIALGNRSTNRLLGLLYDRFYCLADLKYPGPEGYVLRSIHNPFGNGQSVLLVGASDETGLAEGARQFASLLAQHPAVPGELAMGWTMQTKLGRGAQVPTDLRQFETWEASKNYGSTGYFGWNSISKQMAMYCMTGNAANAREAVRLAFPDAQALREIEQIDGERIENKHDPLAGFYHYNAHLAILFWDLIEESPAFSDAERLRITNAFARQLDHRKEEGIYGLTQPPSHGVGSRHGQWSALSLYCLGRYFQKSYPGPVWAQCERAGQLAFQSLHHHAWVAGESDNLFWYNTGIAPILTYLVLSGDRKPLQNGVLAELLRGQEILISGRVPDWALNSAALDFLHKAAYLTGDGRWLTYRDRTGMDTGIFRLGQSFWPGPELKPAPPEDLAGRWSVHRLPEPAWNARASGLPHDQSFSFASYRSRPDASGDFILLDGFNGASRNPYHTFDVLELRLAGRTLLQGYANQVQTSADGMVAPAVAMDAALLHASVVGATAVAVGEVPNAAFCRWRRTLCQRTGRYALIVDEFRFTTNSENMDVATTWQMPGATWKAQQQALCLGAAAPVPELAFELRPCDVQDITPGPITTMTWHGAVKDGEQRIAFTLLASSPAKTPAGLTCLRLAPNAAMLALPQAALAVAGEFGQVKAELAVLAEDHLFGRQLTRAGIGDILLGCDVPVDIDWEFATGRAVIATEQPATLVLGTSRVELRPGRQTLPLPPLTGEPASQLTAGLRKLRATATQQRVDELAASERAAPAGSGLPELPVAFSTSVGGKVIATAIVPGGPDGPLLAAATGTTIHLLSGTGRETRKLQTDGPIRVVSWWAEPGLLLAGCADEKVIAFDREGRRAWTFTSQMAPEVYEAAKNYWFKSAPGHEGIHGLATGVFDGGQSRCFVGSACTVEILDTAGRLVKRTPVFWGPCWKFLLSRAPDGSPNLLVAQWPNGGDSLAVIPSKTLAHSGHSFDGVPSGHSYVGVWTAQNRTALIRADLNGNGAPEIVTAINGTWNRVTTYSEAGNPLSNAQFGPGPSSSPRSRIRDLALADLDGDGRQEILVALAEKLVVCLDHRCDKRWSTQLPSPPLSLRAFRSQTASATRIVCGCDDGQVFELDQSGKPVRHGQIPGRPVFLESLPGPHGPAPVLLTDQGEVKGF